MPSSKKKKINKNESVKHAPKKSQNVIVALVSIIIVLVIALVLVLVFEKNDDQDDAVDTSTNTVTNTNLPTTINAQNTNVSIPTSGNVNAGINTNAKSNTNAGRNVNVQNTTNSNVNTPTNTNTNTSALLNANSATSTTSTNVTTFQNEELALIFDYPTSWGNITIHDDAAAPSGTNMKWLAGSVGSGDHTFLAADDPSNASEGRGGTWFDTVDQINTYEDVTGFCTGKQECEIIQTKENDITVARYNTQMSGFFGEAYPKTYTYYLYNPNSAFSGILISASGIINTDQLSGTEKVRVEQEVADLVDSIDFLPNKF